MDKFQNKVPALSSQGDITLRQRQGVVHSILLCHLIADIYMVIIGSKPLAFNWFKRSNTNNHGISIIGKLYNIVVSIAQIN